MSLQSLLAWPLGTGVTGSAIIGVAGGTFAFIRAQADARKRQAELKSQAERHHAEREANATARHNEQMHQRERHHDQALAQTRDEHEALRNHLTATLRLPAKQPRPAAAKPPAKESP